MIFQIITLFSLLLLQVSATYEIAGGSLFLPINDYSLLGYRKRKTKRVSNLQECLDYCDRQKKCYAAYFDDTYNTCVYPTKWRRFSLNWFGNENSDKLWYLKYQNKKLWPPLDYHFDETSLPTASPTTTSVVANVTHYFEYDTEGYCRVPMDEEAVMRINEYVRRTEFDRLLTLPRTDHQQNLLIAMATILEGPKMYPSSEEYFEGLLNHARRGNFNETHIHILKVNSTAFLYPPDKPVMEVNVDSNLRMSIRRVCDIDVTDAESDFFDYKTLGLNPVGRYRNRCAKDNFQSTPVGNNPAQLLTNIIKRCNMIDNFILFLSYGNQLALETAFNINEQGALVHVDSRGWHFLDSAMMHKNSIRLHSNNTFTILTNKYTSVGSEHINLFNSLEF